MHVVLHDGVGEDLLASVVGGIALGVLGPLHVNPLRFGVGIHEGPVVGPVPAVPAANHFGRSKVDAREEVAPVFTSRIRPPADVLFVVDRPGRCRYTRDRTHIRRVAIHVSTGGTRYHEKVCRIAVAEVVEGRPLAVVDPVRAVAATRRTIVPGTLVEIEFERGVAPGPNPVKPGQGVVLEAAGVKDVVQRPRSRAETGKGAILASQEGQASRWLGEVLPADATLATPFVSPDESRVVRVLSVLSGMHGNTPALRIIRLVDPTTRGYVLDVGQTGGLFRRPASSLQRGQKNRDQQGDDRDDHQQLDQRKRGQSSKTEQMFFSIIHDNSPLET